MGMGPTYQEQQRSRVQCPEFGVDVVAGLLLLHLKSQHGVGQGDQGRGRGADLSGLIHKNPVSTLVLSGGLSGGNIN